MVKNGGAEELLFWKAIPETRVFITSLISNDCCKETSSSEPLCGFFCLLPTVVSEAFATLTRKKGERHKMYELFCPVSTDWIRLFPLQAVDDIVAM